MWECFLALFTVNCGDPQDANSPESVVFCQVGLKIDLKVCPFTKYRCFSKERACGLNKVQVNISENSLFNSLLHAMISFFNSQQYEHNKQHYRNSIAFNYSKIPWRNNNNFCLSTFSHTQAASSAAQGWMWQRVACHACTDAWDHSSRHTACVRSPGLFACIESSCKQRSLTQMQHLSRTGKLNVLGAEGVWNDEAC